MKNRIYLFRMYCSHTVKLFTLLVVCALAWTTGLGETTTQLNYRAKRQIGALLREKAARTPAQQKINTQLIFAAQQRRHGFINRDVPELKMSLELEKDGRVKVDIDAVVSDGLLDAIKAVGGEVLSSFPNYHAIRAVLPVLRIEALAAREDIRFIKPAVQSYTNTGSVNSKGDGAHRSNQARATYGATGAGIKVGVLSDSIDDNQGSLAAAKASGDCPTNLTVLAGQAGTGEGEGLAMLEIVHDLAPAAQLYFASGGGQTTSEAQMAQNVRNLATAGCRVIIDDITFYDESPFQDGVISQAVNDVSAQGVLFFSSAANSGNKNDGTSGTWEGDFVDGGDASFYDGAGARFHAFSPGVVYNQSTQTGNRTILFWSDPLAHSANDYDLFVVDSGGNVVRSSTDFQNGTQDPIEGVNPAESGNYVVIIKFSGAARFLHLGTNRGRLAVSTSGCTYGHNASGAANAFSVAATSAENQVGAFTGGAANPVEDFSSDGFRHIFYNANGTAITPGNVSSTGGRILQKPDITAADGVATTLPGNSGLNPFFGTSAAAPHAGAIAAQILSYRSSLTPAEVRAAMKASCLDIEATGLDRDSGSGIVMALQALQHLPTAATATDFNHDGKSDFVLQDGARHTALWYLNNNAYIGGASAPTLIAGWSLIDLGDFNRDGKPDYTLFNAATRHTAIWYLNNNVLLGGASGPTLGAGWSLAAVGDFNRDGKSDYLLFNAGTRHTAIWYLNNNAYVSGASGPTLAVGWRVAGVGDFNRDGKPDLLLFNAGTRHTAIWYLNNNAYVSGASGPTLPAGWRVVGVADFNRDGKPDYTLFDPGTRQSAIWYLNNNVYVSGASGPTLPAGWILVKP